MRMVTLQIGEEEFAFAEHMATKHGYFGAADFLKDILNAALTDYMVPITEHYDPLDDVIKLQDAQITVLKQMLREALAENIRNGGREHRFTGTEVPACAGRR